MERLKVRDVMTSMVITCGPRASFKEVAELLLYYDVSGIPVVDDDHRLLGIVTESDLLEKEAKTASGRMKLWPPRAAWRRAKRASASAVDDLMTARVHTAGPDDELRSAARRMSRAGVKRLPVVEGGRLVGIVSRHDVLQAFDSPDPELRRRVEAVLGETLPHRAVKAEVSDGVVTLTGSVAYASDATAVAAVVSSIDGVVTVRNDIVAEHPQPFVPLMP